MKLQGKTLIYIFALLSSFVFTTLASPSFADFFPKIVFHEVIMDSEALPDLRMYYLAQIDSMKANTVLSVADSVGTHNPYNLKILGQDSRLKIEGESYEIAWYVHTGHKVWLEAEVIEYDSTKGYQFDFATGVNRGDPDASGGWARLGEAGVNPPGYLIYNLTGVKAYPKYDRYIATYFTLKVSDNSSSDTVCVLEICVGGVLEALIGVRPSDFTSANTYQRFSGPSIFVPRRALIDYRVN
jgi:hypothetical protein